MNTVSKVAALLFLSGSCALQTVAVPATGVVFPRSEDNLSKKVPPFRLAEAKESAKPIEHFKKQFLISSKEETDKEHQRPWLPGDSVAVRYFAVDMGEPNMRVQFRPTIAAWAGSTGRSKEGIVPSPDGRYFFVLSYASDLQRDTKVSTLHVFGVDQARGAIGQLSGPRDHAVPRSQATVAMAGPGKNRVASAGIIGARWTVDSHTILFSAHGDDEHLQGYSLDVATGTVRQLTAAPKGVTGFEARAGRVAYFTYLLEPVSEPDEVGVVGTYPMVAAVRQPNGTIFGLDSISKLRTTFGGYTFDESRRATQDAIEPFRDAAISPDGSMIAYRSLFSSRFSVLKFDAGQPSSTLVTTSVGSGPQQGRSVFWTADSRSVVVVGVREATGASPVPQSESTVDSIAAFKVETRSWHQLEPIRPGESVESAEWSESDGRLTLKRMIGQERSEERVMYQYQGGQWSRGVHNEALAPSAQMLEIRQGMNDPPIPVAIDGKRERALVAADPALKGVHRTRIERFQWRDPDGQMKEGGLLLPSSYQPGETVPVVIQNDLYYVPELFLPDGLNTNSSAAQAIVARGMAVLIIATDDLFPQTSVSDKRSPDLESAAVALRIDAIVDELTERGIAQPTQVAMTGFSRAGYQTHYLVTHSERTLLKAAVVADAATLSYPQYLQQIARGIARPQEYFAAGRSFWQDTSLWLRRDVGFNADRVSTPTLFTEGQEYASAASLQTIGAFLLNEKPFEYLYMPGASHELAWPVQRAAMMTAMADWLAFWMLGEEDPIPTKARQNERWRKVRDDWAAVQAKHPARGEPGFITARSGLAYAIRTRVSGRSPVQGDVLTVNYIGTRVDGTEFVNSYKTGKPLVVQLSQPDAFEKSLTVSLGKQQKGSGWQEGLRVLHPGEKATFIMPHEITFGEEDSSNAAPTGAPVRYEVQLASIQRNGKDVWSFPQ